MCRTCLFERIVEIYDMKMSSMLLLLLQMSHVAPAGSRGALVPQRKSEKNTFQADIALPSPHSNTRAAAVASGNLSLLASRRMKPRPNPELHGAFLAVFSIFVVFFIIKRKSYCAHYCIFFFVLSFGSLLSVSKCCPRRRRKARVTPLHRRLQLREKTIALQARLSCAT
jgi:hypothetical protein